MDGLRGCAILLVLCDHFGLNPPGTFPWGVVGVRLFFLLSGCYLMQRIYAMHSECGTPEGKRMTLVDFYGSRFGRLVPVCYATLVLAAITGLGLAPGEWLWHLFFLTNFLAILKGTWPDSFCHFWSLSIQIQFYLLLPLLFLKVPRRHFGLILVIGLCLSPLYRALCLGLEISPMARWFFLPACLDAFAAGALIVFLEKEKPEFSLRLKRFLPCGIILGSAALAIAYHWRMSCPKGFSSGVIESCECLFLFFALLWVRTRPDSVGNRFLSFRPLAALGVISYSIYALHPWVHIFFLHYIEPQLPRVGITGPWQLAPLFLMVFAVAAVSWKTLEQPRCFSWFTQLFHRALEMPRIGAEALWSFFQPAPVFRLSATLALTGLLAFVLIGQGIFPHPHPLAASLVEMPQEIQELQTELQSTDQEETSIISQEPMELELVPSEPVPMEMPEELNEDFELTL